MPYKYETTKQLIKQEDDRRRKLDDSDKRLIVSLYKLGDTSQRKLARDFGVSRRLVQFILDPAKQRANYQARQLAGGSAQYYDKDKNTEAMRTHRAYKQTLALANRLAQP